MNIQRIEYSLYHDTDSNEKKNKNLIQNNFVGCFEFSDKVLFIINRKYYNNTFFV